MESNTPECVFWLGQQILPPENESPVEIKGKNAKIGSI